MRKRFPFDQGDFRWLHEGHGIFFFFFLGHGILSEPWGTTGILMDRNGQMADGEEWGGTKRTWCVGWNDACQMSQSQIAGNQRAQDQMPVVITFRVMLSPALPHPSQPTIFTYWTESHVHLLQPWTHYMRPFPFVSLFSSACREASSEELSWPLPFTCFTPREPTLKSSLLSFLRNEKAHSGTV